MNATPYFTPTRAGATAGAHRIAPPPRKRRVALYSHDTMGIGHMRRNLRIAQALSSGPDPLVILLIAGAREIHAFGIPDGADYLSLPALHKAGNGDYQSRHLDISIAEMAELRGQSIAAALEAFAPDVFVVDKVPRGAVNELDRALAMLTRKGETRCVLGLRDVLDDPDVVRREWEAFDGDATLRSHYDAVWIYGDPAVYDATNEYDFSPEVAAKVVFTGYLDQRRAQRDSEKDTKLDTVVDSKDRLYLCTVGGGQDGARLADAFAHTVFPKGATGVLLAGPFMPAQTRERIERSAANNPRLKVLPFVNDSERWLERADRIVAMGGYNTVCEALSFDKSTLIVPRVEPRREQLIRAERLRDLGLIDLMHPAELTPQSLGQWLAGDMPPRIPSRQRIDLNGLERLPFLLHDLLHPSTARTARPRADKRCHCVPI